MYKIFSHSCHEGMYNAQNEWVGIKAAKYDITQTKTMLVQWFI